MYYGEVGEREREGGEREGGKEEGERERAHLYTHDIRNAFS